VTNAPPSSRVPRIDNNIYTSLINKNYHYITNNKNNLNQKSGFGTINNINLQNNQNLEKILVKDQVYEYKSKKAVLFTDYELNTFLYNDALIFDKRSYFSYYMSLLRTKNPILFAFFPINDYNSRIIKLSIFLLFFSIIYTINTLFFDENVIHMIYMEGGNYSVAYQIPQIIYAFIISHVLYLIIKYFSLSEKNIVEIKKEEKVENARNKIDSFKKCLIIKYFCFYGFGLLFLFFCWYYLSSFGAVYQNSQKHLVKNIFVCLVFSLVYPFIINLLPAAFRIISLRGKNRDCFYNFSKVIQVI
jgi:hypothetical protein